MVAVHGGSAQCAHGGSVQVAFMVVCMADSMHSMHIKEERRKGCRWFRKATAQQPSAAPEMAHMAHHVSIG
jgi:hypothetical protein